MTPIFLPEHPTQQQVFDAVCEHAARMPDRSTVKPRAEIGEDGGCRYRTEDGANACFIGGLLTDEEVSEPQLDNIELHDSTAFGRLYPKMPTRLRHGDSRSLLIHLQAVHDKYPQTDWPDRLRVIATKFDLSAAAVGRHFPAAPR